MMDFVKMKIYYWQPVQFIKLVIDLNAVDRHKYAIVLPPINRNLELID